jgi:hypothetical protein
MPQPSSRQARAGQKFFHKKRSRLPEKTASGEKQRYYMLNVTVVESFWLVESCDVVEVIADSPE